LALDGKVLRVSGARTPQIACLSRLPRLPRALLAPHLPWSAGARKEAIVQTAKARTEAVAGHGGGTWRVGAAAGLLGAVVMMALMMLAAGLDGDPLDPMRAVGTSFRGEDATQTGAVPAVWGAILHLAIGAAFGAAFLAVFPKDHTAPAGAVLGAGSALLLMGLVISALAPVVAPMARSLMSPNGGAWIVAHAVFGAVAGLGPWLHRRVRERGARRAPDARGVLRPRTAP
jgi:hypothetical protein